MCATLRYESHLSPRTHHGQDSNIQEPKSPSNMALPPVRPKFVGAVAGFAVVG